MISSYLLHGAHVDNALLNSGVRSNHPGVCRKNRSPGCPRGNMIQRVWCSQEIFVVDQSFLYRLASGPFRELLLNECWGTLMLSIIGHFLT